jgi:ubiquinol-cytochrome c reductase cytochrome c subunit
VQRTGCQGRDADSSRAHRALLGWGVVVVAIILVFVARVSITAQAQGTGGQSFVSQDQLQRGAQIYQQQCAQCHGGDGSGGTVQVTGRPAPPLRGTDVAYVDLVLRSGRMPPAGNPFDNRRRSPTVTGADREALVAWMSTAFGLSGQIPQVQIGDPRHGLQVYSAQCAHCHGATGGGGVAGGGAYTPPLTSYEPIVTAEAIRVGPFEMPAFSETQITDQAVGDIAAFLNMIAHERGTPIFGLVELHPVYAAAFVALLAVALVCSLLWIGGRPAWFPDPQQEPESEPKDTS